VTNKNISTDNYIKHKWLYSVIEEKPNLIIRVNVNEVNLFLLDEKKRHRSTVRIKDATRTM